ncbi:hemolysin-like protein [Pseudomonas plecoglossicida]|uniref:Hemolysin-like protein n=1 Tax=Pseudomonas plecoglossicida TaxID=70775 RepID=A0A0B5KDK0_PSEDL|nr:MULTISPECIES: M91 family zinc metallopeptidase [Pseudomonas]AJG12187.1 Putative hemolysin-like protein [Pseudomonas plecoglossicida]MDD1982055.1 type III secretion system effector protein [Pseudomonas asiatica]PBJ96269.1 hemolysin-like protein [Pseudomonas plecoglossicida]
MHPNPIYFISGRTSGFQQFADPSMDGKTVHRFYEYRDDNVDILLEQVWFDQGQVPGKHHMVIQSHASAVDIDIFTYDCHLQANVGSKTFILAPTRRQTLIIKTAPGDAKITVAEDVKTPIIIQAADGNTRIATGGGITEVFTGTGNAQINVGQGLTFIKGGSASTRISGHILVDDPHESVVYARNQPGDARFEQPLLAPLDTLASDTFEIQGSDTFKQAVENHLAFLRHTLCGKQLLVELGNSHQITITETKNTTQFEAYITDPTEEDHHLRQNSRLEWVSGWPAESGTLAFNLTRSDSDNLPLFDFYRCLCEAYNAFKGTTVPGTSLIRTIDRRQISVAKAHLQAIGLPSGLFYDFDNNPQTPPTDTNHSPFSENVLRLELGMPARLNY